ncbi:lymphocyte antigen 6B-like [Canis lupus baileyi]|uniref:lymphocyte antigen 6B-like n=1 Tax=Canis lupus dingo TaxID=286419 RepID=UPI000DC74758|nr:lymphocyte antigen 6B-like [Canis lupus dingo]XP_038541156.1 lymphocyte antigen 6B-like isoform X1 [Canis lupus familiaris]
MKAAALLVVLLCSGGAWAIRCHNCTNDKGNTCSGPVDCPSYANACASQVLNIKLPDQTVALAAKTCVQSCETLNPMPSRASSRASVSDLHASIYCCSTNLCNRAGGQGPGATTVGLMLVASVLVTLLGASL